MAGILYFENGLRCHEHHHGASCAVDALLELYFYGIFKFDPSLSSIQRAQPLVEELNTVCIKRQSTEIATCDMRENVWDLLLDHPDTRTAYAPKGKHTAEILAGLDLLCSSLREKFQTCMECLLECQCNSRYPCQRPLLRMLHVTSGGSLQKSVESILCKRMMNLTSSCIKCNSKHKKVDVFLKLADFLMIEIGLVDALNMQHPALQISEEMSIFNVRYELTGAVLMEPGHFFNVVKCDNTFLLINGTPPIEEAHNYPKVFSTFSGAVSNLMNEASTVHYTSPEKKGIHVLVYHKVTSQDSRIVITDSMMQSPNHNNNIVGEPEDLDYIQLRNQVSPVGGPSCSTPANAYMNCNNSMNGHASDDIPVSPICDESMTDAQVTEKPFRKRLFSSPLSNSNIKGKRPTVEANRGNANNSLAGKCSPKHSNFNQSKTACKNQMNKSVPKTINKGIKLNGVDVKITLSNSSVFLSCSEVFKAMGLLPHIKKDGYSKSIDKRLTRLGFNVKESFIFNGRYRQFIRLDAVIGLLNGPKFKGKNTLNCVKQDMNKFLQSEFMKSIHNSKVAGESHVTPKSRKGKRKKRKTPKKVKKKRLTDALEKCLHDTFKSDKDEMINVMSSTLKSGHRSFDESFFSKDDIVKLLDNAPPSKKGKNQTNLLEEISREHSTSKLSVHELIHLQENFSGCRLFNELRKSLPGVFPNFQQEQTQKHVYWREFFTLLLPERTSSGWKVNPRRLLELLCMKYYWLGKTKHWKVYGDGREIGGRPSTFISFNILNNEAALHDVLFHDPNEVYPVAIFYEKDSRDNLEENLGYPSSWLNAAIRNQQKDGHKFYLAGDEMFLEAILDGSGNLGPTTEEGWNIYSKYPKADFNVTASSGLRTDLSFSIDREHNDNVLPAIPLDNVVLCVLHGIARCVEKLLTLEVQLILKQSNIAAQTGGDATGHRTDVLSNLVNNINKRGVKQGGFNIIIEKNGTLCPIKLNKDHALAIIAPEPPGQEKEYPHVMHNVCTRNKIKKVLPPNVRNALQLKEEYTELELVSAIWGNFYSMIEILKSDPVPCIKDDRDAGSLNPADYIFGYRDGDIKKYVKHAECFYQLFRLRYTCSDLTPYMMKFVDIAPLLMSGLPFSLGRFQSEGGEHTNYQHNRYFFQHTTRHGGRPNHKYDPLLQILCNMYKRISYGILHGDGTESGKLAAETFVKYRDRHMHTSNIPIDLFPCEMAARASKTEQLSSATKPNAKFKGLLDGFVFVFCESIPKYNEKTYTHSQLQGLICKEGGRVRKSIPTSKTSKTYTILTNNKVVSKKRIPLQIRQAIRENCKIVDYKFVLDALERNVLPSIDAYELDVPSVGNMPVTKSISIEEKHFGKASLLSILKKRKQRRKKHVRYPGHKRPIHHPAMFYVYKNMKGERTSFRESIHLQRHYYKKWKTLSKQEISDVTDEWCKYVEKWKLQRKHKFLYKPAYTSFISPGKQKQKQV